MAVCIFALLICVLSSAPCAAYLAPVSPPGPVSPAANMALNAADILSAAGVEAPRPAGAESPGAGVSMTGYVSVWSQACPGSVCAPPVPLVKNRPQFFELALPQAPGQAVPLAAGESFSLGGGGELSLALNFYAVCPYAAAAPGAQNTAPGAAQCSALYFQVQAELRGAAEALCAAAMNEKDFVPFPVLMCGGARKAGKRFGVTLHRNKL